MPTRVINSFQNPGKIINYPDILRGCTLAIPVQIRNDKNIPVDLTEFNVAFTLKQLQSDDFMEDQSALIVKDFSPQAPLNGEFQVLLTPEDTQLIPGEYYFDIELINIHNGSIWRLVTAKTNIKGGPTNRHVNGLVTDRSSALSLNCPTSDIILGILTPAAPIVVISPSINLSNQALERIAKLEEKIEKFEKKFYF